jgi:hypothetical protein
VSDPARALGDWQSRPWVGLLGLALVLLWRVLAHVVVVIENHLLPVQARPVFGLLAGACGVLLAWHGRRRDELGATLLGFAGGALIWMGWFEHGFEALSRSMAVPPLVVDGRYALPPNLVLLQSTTFILVVLLLLLGMSADTGCRMFLWVRRVLRLDPGPPSRNLRKGYARIVALEYVLVSWFMYAVIIALLDPRIAGRDSAATWVAFCGLLGWSAWLIVLCARRPTQPALAVRYAVGAGGIVWLTVELGAQLKLWTEVWVKPLQMPLPNVAFALAFVAVAVLLARHPARGQPAPGESASSPAP